MEKYCTSCGRVLGDVDYTHCPYCGGKLSEREGRQSISNRLRHDVFKRDGYRCRECGASVEDGATLEIDHIIPVAKGGTNDINNLQTLCKECNRGKYTDEWVGGESDLEVAENEYNLLLEKKQGYKQKLLMTTNEDDIIEYKYALLKLEESLEEVEEKIHVLRIKRAQQLREQEEKEIKDKLFKKLYITLTDNQLNLLYAYFTNIPHSRDDIILYLVDNYSESQIKDILIKLERREELFKKLSITLTKHQLKLLYEFTRPKINLVYMEYADIDYARTEVIRYLCENYSENEIYSILKKLEEKEETKNEISNILTDDLLELLYDEFNQVKHSKDAMVNYLYSNYSVDEIKNIVNRLQREKEKREKLYNKLSDTLTDSHVKYITDKYSNLKNCSRTEIINYLCDEYSEYEINVLLDQFQKEKEEKDNFALKLYNTLTDSQVELLSNKFTHLNNLSRPEIINYLCEEYSENEFNALMDQLQKEKEEKDEFIKKLYEVITDPLLIILYDRFPDINRSKEDIINYLIDNYPENEINSILYVSQREQERKEQFLKEIHDELLGSEFDFFCVKFNYNGSKDEFADYLNNHFSKNEINQVVYESQKDRLFSRLYNNDDLLELLSVKIYRGSRSKDEYLEYVFKEYSIYEIQEKLSKSKMEKEEKEQLDKKLSNLSDDELKALYLKYPRFNNSKEKLINYLSKNYSVKQVYSIMDEIQEKLDNQMDENTLKQSLTPKRMELLAKLDSSYKDENYQKLIDKLIWNYSGKQIKEILHELDNINNQIDELEKQKDMHGFYILGFEDAWYYYYLTSNNELKRFYAFSKHELERKVSSKNLHWYHKFKCSISSSDQDVRKFINRLCSKIIVIVPTPHENFYPIDSRNSKPDYLKKEVMLHLDSISEYDYPETLFKPIFNRDSLTSNTIICPNCGKRIQRKAVRCKYCKTMMKDLLDMVDNELELHGLNPDDFELV